MSEDLRRHIMMQQGGGGLPSEYQEVISISKLGYNYPAYAETNIDLSQKITIEMYATPLNTNGYATSSSAWNFTTPQFSSPIRCNVNGWTNISPSVYTQTNHLYHLIFDYENWKAYFDDDGVIRSFSNTSWGSSGKLRIFYGSNANAVSISYIKVARNHELLGEYVPCYRKSDGIIGFYDFIERQFIDIVNQNNVTKGADGHFELYGQHIEDVQNW